MSRLLKSGAALHCAVTELRDLKPTETQLFTAISSRNEKVPALKKQNQKNNTTALMMYVKTHVLVSGVPSPLKVITHF